MGDINAKREARRRKILENSESRLCKITSSHVTSDGTEDTIDEINARGEAGRQRILENPENHLNKIAARSRVDETETDNKPPIESCNTKSNLEGHIVRNGTCNLENDINLQYYTDFNEDAYERFHARFNENKYDGQDERFLSNINEKNMSSSEEVTNEKSMLWTYLPYRMSVIALAAIVNILLMLELDDWFGKTAFVPYLLLVTSRLYDFKRLQEVKYNNLFTVVCTVILWRIKPSLICKLKALLVLLNVIVDDLCLYMFSFVLMRYMITIYCYRNHIIA